VDYGCGNLQSIKNMLKSIGVLSTIISNPAEVANAKKIILPGVGSFDTGMKALQQNNWIDKLNDKVLIDRVPILGICLGMQLMTNQSEEGATNGLQWIDAETIRFQFTGPENEQLRVPHMGWNVVSPVKDSLLFQKESEEQRFYHVHSYYVKLNNSKPETATTHYGFDFTSAFQQDNIYGVQFHPEKSHRFGKILLKKFAEI
jgi:imidazole glycerol-phosphate synthase subunit HisH